MWILPKPELSDAKNDIEVVVSHCNNLDDSDKTKMSKLYEDYNGGKGEVTNLQLQPLDGKKEIIKKQYAKMSGKQNGKDEADHLVYIRKDLMKNVDNCPYCSINAPQELDHFMDKALYGQLAVCRLNLVPLCATCNHAKGQISYKEFIHAYYQVLPQKPFFKADCRIVRNNVIVTFSIDSTIITDLVLRKRMEKQMQNINLAARLGKAVNEFLSQLCLSSFVEKQDDISIYLRFQLKNYEQLYAMNDWRCATIRGLINCPQFNIDVINNYRKNKAPINRIGA